MFSDHISSQQHFVPSYSHQTLPSKLPPMQQQAFRAYGRHSHPVDDFNEQYNQLQQARMEQQLKTQNEALRKQQETFAIRQMLNPPLMSRQASAINLNQSHSSTQTTASVQNSPTVQPSNATGSPFRVATQFERNGTVNATKPNQLQLQQEQQQLLHALQNDLKLNQQYQIARNAAVHSYHKELQLNIEQAARHDDGAQSPVHQALTFKESAPSSATSTPTKVVKSPKTKRHPSALVSFSGWLYKQGSDGLRVWRKRWFVLSEYCLFYYKGPEEEKLLGSILLPSYTLSECLPSESKTYRKFSFKLEHKNMRTYYLASENADYMRKWMRVIRAATLMQNFHEIQTRNMLAQAKPVSTMGTLIAKSYETGGSNYPDQFNRQKYLNTANHSLNPFLNNDEGITCLIISFLAYIIILIDFSIQTMNDNHCMQMHRQNHEGRTTMASIQHFPLILCILSGSCET